MKWQYKNSYLSYFLMYNFYYLSWALFSSLISVYLMGKGFTGSQVALVVSSSFLASMVTQPFIGSLNDRYDIKKVNAIMFGLAIMGGIIFLLAKQFWAILLGYSFVMILINGSNPVMERVATASPFQYGRIRIWGTIGYALGTQIAGILYDMIAPSAIFVAFLVTMALTIVGLLGTSPEFGTKKQHQKQNSFTTLLTNKKYLYYLLLISIFFGVTNVGNTYIPTMLTHDGLQASTASTVLSLAVICEAPLVLFSYKFMDRVHNKMLMMIAFTMVLIQYGVYGLNMPLILKIIVTMLGKHPAAMLFIMINLKVVNTIVDEQSQMTALAFVQTIRNLASILFNNIGGQLLDATSYSFMFMVCFVVMVIGMILLVFYKIESGNHQKLFSKE